VAEVAQKNLEKMRQSCVRFCTFLMQNITLVLSYFGKFWQRTAKQRPSKLFRPNEVQKLHIFRNKVFVDDNDKLYCKLCTASSLATLAQGHQE